MLNFTRADYANLEKEKEGNAQYCNIAWRILIVKCIVAICFDVND